MAPQRTCRYVPLSQQPLVFVLGQVRFSPLREMARYITAIQEAFRRDGFPLEKAGKIQHVVITPSGVQTTEIERWEYRTRDERWSVTIFQDNVVVQTTAYERFEGFADRMDRALRAVLDLTEHRQLGVIQRVGLRYVNAIHPREKEDFRYYLRPGFHGGSDAIFLPGTHRLHVESIGRTRVADETGTFIVRVAQNDQGFDLPPDLVGSAPLHTSRAQPGQLVTLVDLDHFIEGNFDPEPERVVELLYGLHDHLIETFHENVVSPEAIEVWR